MDLHRLCNYVNAFMVRILSDLPHQELGRTKAPAT
jgi:hypothetical protein